MNPVSQLRGVARKAKKAYSYRTYDSAKEYVRSNYFRKHPDLRTSEHKPILVYQMGKVGSKTIVHSLTQSSLPNEVLHIHVVTQSYLDQLEDVLRKAFPKLHHVPPHLIVGEFIRDWEDEARDPRPWIVVSIVRDPIARNLSCFVQDIDLRQPEFNYQEKVDSMPMEELAPQLTELFLSDHDHDRPLEWFDVELKQTMGIDVFCEPFPKEKGYATFENDRAKLLLLKLEKLNACGEDALSSFFELEGIKLVHANIATEKKYSDVYKKYLKFISLPESYLDKMYDTKLAKHFYTHEEIASMRKKWSGQK